MSVLKYINEQDQDSHGQRLYWPGYYGLPVRGHNAPTLTQEEFETQIEVDHDFHSGEFDLSVPEQKKQYDAIMDRVVNNWYVLYYRDPPKRLEDGKRVVYIEWSQRYGSIKPNAYRGFASSIPKVG